VEGIQTIKEEESEEEDENDMPTSVTPDVEELLLIKRPLHVTKTPHEKNPREKISNFRYAIRAKVCSLIIDGDSCTTVASNTPIEKL